MGTDCRDDLGGRLTLVDSNEASPEQLDTVEYIKQRLLPAQQDPGIQIVDSEGHPIGPFNAFVVSPTIGRQAMQYFGSVSANSTLPAAVREVVILSVGGLWGADYEIYAHKIAARAVDVPESAIQSLAKGEEPVGLTGNQLIAARFTQEIVRTRHVDDALYQDAVGAFGQRGVVDMAQLAGAYLSVSALLNVFEVPAPPST
ncbi:carboxymuconolactone decarboxylase family protein [Prescottella sp. R16]|uniref:carboxymuconolactone decarboxylase family protein n=1 Tax=Prescottella sp. R16 TaxID=3064529 RepID=UPI00272E8817|nr:carboxymuconolactone decarboxylase family protein [Prescottella sp. R16]